MDAAWADLRNEFPVLKDWTYLNTASFGPIPQCVVRAANAHFEHRDTHACLDFLDWFTDIDGIRAKLAQLIGAAPDDVAFISNTASALSWLLTGIDWKPGDHVLTLSDEFPNNLYFGGALERQGVHASTVPIPNDRFSLESLTECLTDQTRIVLVSSVNYSTGLRPPLDEIGTELRKRNILFYVDGTQSVGALPADVAAFRIDVMAVHAYKWMCCPTGTGFAYVAPHVREWLQPNIYSWRSHRDWRNVDHLHHGKPELPESAIKYEGGMQNLAGIYAMGAVAQLFETLGVSRIHQEVHTIAEQTRDVLRNHGADLLSDLNPHYDSPIIAGRFQDIDASKLAVELQEQRITTAARKGNLRVSPHFFNNQEDLARLDEALRTLLRR
jgi:selenocysteine lyase/cysteine desulfurase